MSLYGEREEAVRPALQIAMPRLPRLYAPEGTMHVVARCNNREFYFTSAEDFEILLDHLGEMSIKWVNGNKVFFSRLFYSRFQ